MTIESSKQLSFKLDEPHFSSIRIFFLQKFLFLQGKFALVSWISHIREGLFSGFSLHVVRKEVWNHNPLFVTVRWDVWWRRRERMVGIPHEQDQHEMGRSHSQAHGDKRHVARSPQTMHGFAKMLQIPATTIHTPEGKFCHCCCCPLLCHCLCWPSHLGHKTTFGSPHWFLCFNWMKIAWWGKFAWQDLHKFESWVWKPPLWKGFLSLGWPCVPCGDCSQLVIALD